MNAETNPRITKEVGNEVLRLVSGLDLQGQLAVLRWAHTRLRRRKNPKGQANNTSFKPHAVTLGMHDATIIAGRADGTSLKVIAAQIGCSTNCVQNRAITLRETAQ